MAGEGVVAWASPGTAGPGVQPEVLSGPLVAAGRTCASGTHSRRFRYGAPWSQLGSWP